MSVLKYIGLWLFVGFLLFGCLFHEVSISLELFSPNALLIQFGFLLIAGMYRMNSKKVNVIVISVSSYKDMRTLFHHEALEVKLLNNIVKLFNFSFESELILA